MITMSLLYYFAYSNVFFKYNFQDLYPNPTPTPTKFKDPISPKRTRALILSSSGSGPGLSGSGLQSGHDLVLGMSLELDS